RPGLGTCVWLGSGTEISKVRSPAVRMRFPKLQLPSPFFRPLATVSTMSLLDFAIIAAYLLGITLFGLRFRKKQRSLRDYFLADRTIPWWAIALSIVAAETSTLTIISVPAIAYDRNFTFLQLIFG